MAAAKPETVVSPEPRTLVTYEHAPTYGDAYQRRQAQKYREREHNHWKLRVDLAFTLARRFALPLSAKPWHEMSVLDVGCSIGTFAIEFAKVGARTTGVDADATGLEVARELALEQGVRPTFLHADVTELTPEQLAACGAGEGFDMIVAFDLFEHLHDDEMGVVLGAMRRLLAPRGVLIYHTFPTEFDYIFAEREGVLAKPLLAYTHLPPEQFERVTRSYAAWLDAEWIAQGGRAHADHIEREQHCNPTTPERLAKLLQRCKLHNLSLERSQMYPCEPPFGASMLRDFVHQPITHRNIYGAACRA
jgi:2-polyprenyl-3-methyl-5-hydroxy-6-metoxy-1,4-benzoquinol methylase